jgi:hypothetical protein
MSTRIRLSATLLAGLILAVPAPSLAADPTPPPAPAAEAVPG